MTTELIEFKPFNGEICNHKNSENLNLKIPSSGSPSFFTQLNLTEPDKSFPLQNHTHTDSSVNTSSIIVDESSLEGAAAQLVALKDLFSNPNRSDDSKGHSDDSEVISCSSNSENESPIKVIDKLQEQLCKELSDDRGEKDKIVDLKMKKKMKRKRPLVFQVHGKRRRGVLGSDADVDDSLAGIVNIDEDEKLGLFKVKIVNDLSVFMIPPNKKRVFEYQFD